MIPSPFMQFLLAICALAIGYLITPSSALAVPPSNGNFANATLLTGNAGTVSVSILEATFETNEPAACGQGTAWYKWVAPAQPTTVGIPPPIPGAIWEALQYAVTAC